MKLGNKTEGFSIICTSSCESKLQNNYGRRGKFMAEAFVLDNLLRYIGQTVTIFTTSGGLSGSGFTGVLAGVCDNTVKLITDIGAAPSCPVGSNCCSCSGGFGFNNGYGYGNYYGYNWLGSVTEIPICKIASFTHNAI